MEIATIGFTRSSAERFFERLRDSGAASLVDVRLHSTSQLAGFAKSQDLPYFLEQLCGMAYRAEPALAPTSELLDAYRAGELDWAAYETSYADLLQSRTVETCLEPLEFNNVVLLCSEAAPDNCHRRIAAEYLQSRWPNVAVRHL